MRDDDEYKTDTKDPLVFEARFASRKFLLTLLVLVAVTVLRVLGFVDTAAWSEVTRWALGLYMAGNVGTWLADTLKARP